MRTKVQSLALLRGFRIQCCHDLQYRLQMQLRSCVVAVAEAGHCGSDSIPSLETSICHKCGPKKTKKNLNYFVSFYSVTYAEI